LIVLFLLSPTWRDHIGELKQQDESSLRATLKAIFNSHDVNGPPLSDECQHFIRHCLYVEPRKRMKAVEARNHPWLQLDEQLDRECEKLRRGYWKPTHRIAPPVQDLGDPDTVTCSPLRQDSRYIARTLSYLSLDPEEVVSDSQTSPHFPV
jgi:serine/threonine protein kinase